MSNDNKNLYKKTYHNIHVSPEFQERLLDMVNEDGETGKFANKRITGDGRKLDNGRRYLRNFGIRHKGWRVAAAVAVLVLALPISVYASGRISDYLFKGNAEKKDYQIDISVRKDEADATAASKDVSMKASKKTKPVSLEGTSIGGYTLDKDEDGYYDFNSNNGFEAGRDFSVQVIKVDVNADKSMVIDDVNAAKDINVNGQKAVLLHRNDIVGSAYNEKTTYTRRVIVFYEKLGYILHFYAMEGLSESELTRYAGQIKLKPCDKKSSCGYMLLSEYMCRNRSVDESEVRPLVIKDKNMYKVGDTVHSDYEDVEYEIQSVDVSDNISDILKGETRAVRDGVRDLKKLTDSDGNLLPYVRETVTEGDGKKTPYMKVASREKVALKFVELKVRVKNTGKKAEDVEVCKTLCAWREENGVRYEHYPAYGKPAAVDNCQMGAEYFRESGGGNRFYFKKLKPGEERILHIGYIVDADMLKKMAVRMDYWSAGDEIYIDISR